MGMPPKCQCLFQAPLLPPAQVQLLGRAEASGSALWMLWLVMEVIFMCAYGSVCLCVCKYACVYQA